MANYTKLTDLFTGIANAIRSKTGSSSTIVADNFPTAISGITTVQEGTADATASASDILSGKTAYVSGSKVTGSIVSKSSSDLSSSGATVTVPAGYYASQVSKSVATATQATPSISVSSSGVITASATQSAGYVSSGTKTATKNLTTQGAQTITPGTNDKTISSGRYLTGTQTIKGDSNLVASNIKSGVSIFGVNGNAKTVVEFSLIISNDTNLPDHGAQIVSPSYTNKIFSTSIELKKGQVGSVVEYPTLVISKDDQNQLIVFNSSAFFLKLKQGTYTGYLH